ncbi:MAG TPA: DUF4136 domain-containing protein [Sphingomicrobium sp.]|nr:DUF4136 domain-containing protein [Sphingomicrobium sp.]
MRILKLAAAAMLGVASIGLTSCATGFPAKVSRYQAMPAPVGQSFFVLPFNGADVGGLEFAHHAVLVRQAMSAQGYAEAASPAAATMLVRLGYGVDDGHTEVVSTPYGGGYGDPFFGGFGRPYYSRFGYGGRFGYGRYPFYYGWDDPFWYGDSGIRSYTVYVSHLDMDIRRRVDNASLFEGHAKARSRTDDLNVIVPNLVEAMFTGFPGRSGETVKITVPPPAKRAS